MARKAGKSDGDRLCRLMSGTRGIDSELLPSEKFEPVGVKISAMTLVGD